jgi:HK97 family phage prohead protease
MKTRPTDANRASTSFSFELKSLNEDGSFVGVASVYGNKDLGGDVVDRGAFTKTLKERGSRVPILWQHDQKQPIGYGEVTDSADGLKIAGKLTLGVTKASEAHALMKDDVISGLSIGYDTVKQKHEGGARHLQELKLYEVSLVTFPMNEDARVSSVKTFDPAAVDVKSLELPAEVHAIVTGAIKAASLDARLRSAYEAIREAFPLTYACVLEVYDEAIIVSNNGDYYSVAVVAWDDEDGTPTLGDVTEVVRVYVPAAADLGDDLEAAMQAAPGATKAGRVISASNHTKLMAAQDHLEKAVAHVADVVKAARPNKPAMTPAKNKTGNQPTAAATDDESAGVLFASLKANTETLRDLAKPSQTT